MQFDMVARDLLAFYFLFVGLHYGARLVALKDRTGIRHAHMGRPGSPNRRHQLVFRWFRTLILVVFVARVPFPEVDRMLLVFTPLNQPLVVASGHVLLVAALGWVDYVHSYMHADWRSGLGDDPGGALIATGPFALSCNPTFLGIITGQVGLFLALPSVFTLVCLLMGVLVIRRQVIVEERLLPGRFGAAYDGYVRSVPRWISRESLARWRSTVASGPAMSPAAETGVASGSTVQPR